MFLAFLWSCSVVFKTSSFGMWWIYYDFDTHRECLKEMYVCTLCTYFSTNKADILTRCVRYLKVTTVHNVCHQPKCIIDNDARHCCIVAGGIAAQPFCFKQCSLVHWVTCHLASLLHIAAECHCSVFTCNCYHHSLCVCLHFFGTE